MKVAEFSFLKLLQKWIIYVSWVKNYEILLQAIIIIIDISLIEKCYKCKRQSSHIQIEKIVLFVHHFLLACGRFSMIL